MSNIQVKQEALENDFIYFPGKILSGDFDAKTAELYFENQNNFFKYGQWLTHISLLKVYLVLTIKSELIPRINPKNVSQ